MEANSLFDIALEQSVLVVIAIVTIFLAYRFINIKLEMMKRDFEDRLKLRAYQAKGQISILKDEKGDKVFVDVTIEERLNS